MYQRRYHKKGNRWRIEASKKNTSLLILTLRIHQKTLQTKYFATSDSVIKTLPEINTSFLLKLEPNIHQPLRKSRMSERWVINTTTASLCYFVVQISVCWHKQTSATTGSSSSSSAIFFFPYLTEHAYPLFTDQSQAFAVGDPMKRNHRANEQIRKIWRQFRILTVGLDLA